MCRWAQVHGWSLAWTMRTLSAFCFLNKWPLRLTPFVSRDSAGASYRARVKLSLMIAGRGLHGLVSMKTSPAGALERKARHIPTDVPCVREFRASALALHVMGPLLNPSRLVSPPVARGCCFAHQSCAVGFRV